MLEYPLLLLFPAAMVYAAVMDFFTMTIPNKISVVLVIAFFATALLAGVSGAVVLDHVAAGALVLMVSIFMFAMGWFGGGDAKLLSVAALWFGFERLEEYALDVTIIGGVLALVIILYRQAVPPMWITGLNWAEPSARREGRDSYGIALALPALWLFPTSHLFLMHVS